MTTLLLSQRQTDDSQALWRAAIARGWGIERAQGIQVPEINDDIVMYMEPFLGHTIADSLGLTLLEPEEDWLPKLPWEYRKREIRLTTLGQIQLPAFIKPPNDKSFEAGVYDSKPDLPDDTVVLVSEIVEWELEYRCFALDGKVKTISSPYLSNGPHEMVDLIEAKLFSMLALDGIETPRAIVLDVGRIEDCGWAVVEANGAWGSGIYDCDANRVLDVIKHATVQGKN